MNVFVIEDTSRIVIARRNDLPSCNADKAPEESCGRSGNVSAGGLSPEASSVLEASEGGFSIEDASLQSLVLSITRIWPLMLGCNVH